MGQALDAPESAKLSPAVRAALAFIEKLVRQPARVGPADVKSLRDAGLTDDAIEDAAFVCALFTTFVRLADTLEFDVPPAAAFEQSAQMLLRVGYAFPPPVAWMVGDE